jgi:acyl dehydratase
MLSVSDIRRRINTTLGTSQWYDVRQDLIDQFSAATLDDDPMHLDVEWSRRNTPFGGTIAAGFWTTSMLIRMSHDIGFIEEFGGGADSFYALNYGFDRLRLVAPVPVGSRIRGHMGLLDCQERGADSRLLSIDVSVEVEGQERPALIAHWLALVVPQRIIGA